jgi:3-methylcrotonyl-CoA carboxylase alpha subunit
MSDPAAFPAVRYVEAEVEGRPIRMAVVRTARGVWVGWPGGAQFFTAERPRADAQRSDVAEVRAPMTGRVARVLVAPGGAVKADEALVILQAMKMEYRLTAPQAGTVEQVLCAEGEMVDLGATLVTLAAAETGASRAVPAPRKPVPAARAPRRKGRR